LGELGALLKSKLSVELVQDMREWLFTEDGGSIARCQGNQLAE